MFIQCNEEECQRLRELVLETGWVDLMLIARAVGPPSIVQKGIFDMA